MHIKNSFAESCMERIAYQIISHVVDFPRPLKESVGLVTNPTIFCWLFTITSNQGKNCLSTNTLSEFVSIVINGVPGPALFVRHT